MTTKGEAPTGALARQRRPAEVAIGQVHIDVRSSRAVSTGAVRGWQIPMRCRPVLPRLSTPRCGTQKSPIDARFSSRFNGLASCHGRQSTVPNALHRRAVITHSYVLFIEALHLAARRKKALGRTPLVLLLHQARLPLPWSTRASPCRNVSAAATALVRCAICRSHPAGNTRREPRCARPDRNFHPRAF